MDDQGFEHMLERLMKQDLSAGTDGFRDFLLNRCLAVLDADSNGVPIDDSSLDLLAAAGDPDAIRGFDDRWNDRL